VGDANQKVDYIYDAVEFYEKALEVEPDNLETLVRLRESLIRLNREKVVEEINQQIEEVVSAQVKEWVDRWIEKGQNFYQNLVLDGSEVVLKIYLENGEIGLAPLVSVFWNGRVMWEDYLELGEDGQGSGAFFLGLNSKVGENQIRISPVNQRVRLLRVEWEK